VRAIQFDRFGGPEVLQVVELPEPQAGTGQVRIAVQAIGINPIDCKMRSGSGSFSEAPLPQSTGIDIAGVVDELGEGVSDVAVGDSVFGFSVGASGAAELALMAHYAAIPAQLSFAQAAALPVVAEAATRCLELLGVGPQWSGTLLINGASGAVGLAALQLAREQGARVIGTASAANHDYLRSFGVEPTTYGDGLVGRVRELAPGGVDAALDAAGGAMKDLVQLVGDPQHVLTLVDFQAAAELGAKSSSKPSAFDAFAHVAELASEGRFSLAVAQTFAFEDIADAQALLETRHVRGKVIVLGPDPSTHVAR
jgi:NADPH:quinone reductase-like Zn-dependent oxidoreductase